MPTTERPTANPDDPEVAELEAIGPEMPTPLLGPRVDVRREAAAAAVADGEPIAELLEESNVDGVNEFEGDRVEAGVLEENELDGVNEVEYNSVIVVEVEDVGSLCPRGVKLNVRDSEKEGEEEGEEGGFRLVRGGIGLGVGGLEREGGGFRLVRGGIGLGVGGGLERE